MTDGLPSDAKMQAYIILQVNEAKDIGQLTRTILKDRLATKFKLSSNQRALLDSDAHYKTSIKAWITDAIENKPDEKLSTDVNIKSPPKKKSIDEKVSKKKEVKEDDEDKGNMSEFSSLDDEVEPKKKKARKSKGSPASGDGAVKSTTKKTADDSIESKLKKLKGYVLLCGTRKPWKRLFEEAACPDDENASEEEKTKAKKRQIAVIEKVLLDLGMTQPFTKAKAAYIQEKKEMQQDVEAIQVANKTERSTTRGVKGRTSKTKTESPEIESKIEYMQVAPEVRKFNRSLADFAAELNED